MKAVGRSRNELAVLVLAAACTACAGGATRTGDSPPAVDGDAANWALYGRTFSANHYSPLEQINDGNVSRLGLAWYHDLPVVSSVLAAPIAVDGVLYFTVGYSVVHAMGAASGRLLWTYDPKAPEASGMKLRGGWGIRGIAFWDGRVYAATHDGRLIALDAKTGRPSWSVQTLDPADGSYITGPPWIFDGKVAIGFAGGDFDALRGYVTAYDARTGDQAWRFYTVPGNPADGFENAAMEMAAKTWTGEWWRFGGGGTVWHAMAYDRKYGRLYIGVGNGTPWNQKVRSPGGGDNLFLCSIVALDAKTGEYAWHYQVNPGETWDYNAAMDIELATLEIGGRQRDVILHAPKNGFFYVIDRNDGRLLSAEKFVTVNWAERIDPETGRPVENPEARFPGGKPFLMFPGPVGAHSAQSMSFNPKTGLVYIPATEMGRVYVDPDLPDLSQWTLKPGMFVNNALGVPPASIVAPPPTSMLLAWDPVRQQKAWSVPQTGVFSASTTTTAGNLVLQGDVKGEFAAYAADTGAKLWSFDAQAGIQGQPITYLVNGRQFVTVIAGWRGMGGATGLKPEWDYYTQKRRVLTFALDEKAALPPADRSERPFVDDPAFFVDQDKAAAGARVFGDRCVLCHGVRVV